MTTLGGLIPAMLAARGFDTVFGIPGVHTVEMYRGLAGSGLRHVTPRHEQGAGFMADGYARATGRPAACFIITGPGMTNIATAMGQAHGDSVPMLVISSVGPAAMRGRGGLHEMKDQLATLSGVSGLSLQVEDAAGLAAALDEAMDLFASARPRPVHIQIPTDRLAAAAGAAPPPRAPAAQPAVPEAALAEAAAILNRAARPLLILGGGACGLGRDARLLAETLGAPVLMTANGRGLLPPAHPLNAGGELFAEGARRLIAASDAALALGCEFGPTDWSWNGEPDPEFGGPLIRVDIDAAQLRIGPAAALAVHAEAAGFARALLPLVARAPAAPRRLPAPGAGLELRIARHLPLLEAIWDAMPEAMVFGDSTEPAYAAHAAARPPATGLWASSATPSPPPSAPPSPRRGGPPSRSRAMAARSSPSRNSPRRRRRGRPSRSSFGTMPAMARFAVGWRMQASRRRASPSRPSISPRWRRASEPATRAPAARRRPSPPSAQSAAGPF